MSHTRLDVLQPVNKVCVFFGLLARSVSLLEESLGLCLLCNLQFL